MWGTVDHDMIWESFISATIRIKLHMSIDRGKRYIDIGRSSTMLTIHSTRMTHVPLRSTVPWTNMDEDGVVYEHDIVISLAY